MKTLKTILLGACVLGLTTVTAQTQGSGVSLPGQINTSMHNATRLSNLIFEKFLDTKEKENPIAFEDIQGSPYDPADFVAGEFLMDGQPSLGLNMRYNMYDDEIEVKEDDGTITAFLRNTTTSFRIGDRLYRPFKYTEDGLTKDANFEVLVDGDIKLLKRRQVVLIPPEKAPTPNQQDRAAKFIEQTEYYTVRGEGAPVPFKEKKGELLELFPEHASEIKSLIKEQNLKVKRQDDLVLLFESLNGST